MNVIDHSHTQKAIEKRLHQKQERSYIRDFIYGSIDGTVTTFAIIAGSAGAGISEKVVLTLGVVNLVADGFSIAVGNYEGVKAEKELVEKYRRMEAEHIERIPEGEKEELLQIYKSKGFEGEELHQLVESISTNKEAWIEVMLKEEQGLSTATGNPKKAAAITYFAFCWLGVFPLLPYIFKALQIVSLPNEEIFLASCVITACTFYAIGAVKGKFVGVTSWKAGLSTLGTGGAAAVIAYVAGHLVSRFI